MALRAGPYFAPRPSSAPFVRAQEDIRRLEAQVQDLETRNKELKEENEKLVAEAKEKDVVMKEMSERIERLRVIMGGVHEDMTDE